MSCFVLWNWDLSLNIEKIHNFKNIRYLFVIAAEIYIIISLAGTNSIRLTYFRSSHLLKKFAYITRKHLCWSLSLIRLQTSGRLQHLCFVCFPRRFVKLLRTPLLKNIGEWLLLLFVWESWDLAALFAIKVSRCS